MTDIELIEKKLAFIETRVQELRTHSNPALIATDLREERFAAHTLQIAIQAALDVALHRAGDLLAFVAAIRQRLQRTRS